ncbi:MAG: metallophosphoesterase, partial [Bacteroidales bacterium]|nr:metallophosphoesterase [Bacteroidales bacterium]
EFVNAPWKIVLIHIPTISHITPWYTQQWLCDNVLPVLNEAGVDLMLSGHHHKYIYVTPGAEGNKNAFPILVNSNVDRLDCSVTAKSINIKIINQEGKEIHSHSLSK